MATTKVFNCSTALWIPPFPSRVVPISHIPQDFSEAVWVSVRYGSRGRSVRVSWPKWGIFYTVDGSQNLHHLGCIKLCKWMWYLPYQLVSRISSTINAFRICKFPNHDSVTGVFVSYCWRKKSCTTCLKPCKPWDIYHINRCRISAINSSSLSSTLKCTTKNQPVEAEEFGVSWGFRGFMTYDSSWVHIYI